MSNKYRCVPFDSLKDGEMILAFGRHVARWDFDLMGDPAYGFVPVGDDDQQTQEQQEWIHFDYDDEDTFPEEDGLYGVLFRNDGDLWTGASYFSVASGFSGDCIEYYCELNLPPIPEEE